MSTDLLDRYLAAHESLHRLLLSPPPTAAGAEVAQAHREAVAAERRVIRLLADEMGLAA